MSELKDVITSYNSLSFSDRIVFYTTISNDIPVSDDMQSFLIETRFEDGVSCIYCKGNHVVKNGNDIHAKGLSSEKVCVPSAVSDAGISYAKPGKLGKISADCITNILGNKIAPHTILCTDKEKEIRIKAKHGNIKQIRIKTDQRSIRIMLVYEQETNASADGRNIMGIDLGVDNLITVSLSLGGMPVIINGRPLKSINRYYNKRKAILQETAKKVNRLDITNRMKRLTEKRNNKVKDYLHKASRRVIALAQASGVNHIVIGNNKGWKQKVKLGKRTNQTFVAIPYRMLIDMICYKAQLAGIRVSVVKENYTSGTSYLDGETPEKGFYNISRRIKRGLFKSSKGTLINADVNAAYQIIKVGGFKDFPIKENEEVVRLNVA
ncbi:MAG: transposase [Lachnospiraceae bacterium]|nr:transposase [Lachnospiraceae bacterium]